MSTENSLNTAENAEITSSPSETQDTTVSERSLREELAAALHIEIEDTPPEPVQDVAADVQAEAEQPETPTLVALEAPQNWPAEQREKFTTLPRETQEWFLAREKEMVESYTRKTTELAEQRRPVDEINSVFEPYKQQMELAGVSPAQAIQRLLAAQRFLETDPQGAMKWLAAQYQVDLSGFAPREDDAYVDPAVKALRDEVAQLKAERQREAQKVQTESISVVQKQINEFKDSKNEDGTLKYPHFDRVKAIMAPLVNEGKSLAEAYETAKYTLPEIREHIAAEAAKAAQAEALKKAEEVRKAKAKDVKGATQVIRSRGTAAEEGGKPKSLREELAKNLAEQAAGRI